MRTSDISKVIEGGYCVGCGVCSAASGKFGMKLNSDGALVPDIDTKNASLSSVSSICPFSNEVPDETEIGRALYGDNNNCHIALGYFCATYAGYVNEKKFRETGSSGGMGSWLLTEMLKKGLVDHVLHVRSVDPSTNNGKLFSYCLSSSEDDIRKGGKSRYYPITMNEVLAYVMENSGRYAISGVPCFVKAVRLLAERDQRIKERVVFTLGLICGHLKTTGFGESLAWQSGVEPHNIKAIDFRYKLSSSPANDYAFMVSPKDGSANIVTPMRELLGRDWGMGFFKLKACEFCDDVTAETADVSIGDAWLPEYSNDSKGTNVVIIRNPVINDLIQKGIEEMRISLSEIDPERVALSQDAGLRHRREGLSYRLWLKDKNKEWRPNKRVDPKVSIPFYRRLILSIRYQLMCDSIYAFNLAKEQHDLSIFFRKMKLKVTVYHLINLSVRILKRVKGRIQGSHVCK